METLFNSPDKFASRFATVDGYRTHYVEAGEGNPERLLLVHGGAIEVGMGCYRWYANVIPLAKKFHVFAIDELGHGYTDPPRNLDDLSHIRVRADHVLSFIETLGLGPVNLAGQSQGGWIVTYITLKRPDLVKKLILIDSGSTAGRPAEVASVGSTEVDGVPVSGDATELPYYKELFEPGTMRPKEGLTTTREGVRKYASAFFHDKSMVTEEFLDHLMELSGKWSQLYMDHRGKDFWSRTSLADHRRQLEVDGKHIREHVHRIETPTLVVWGRNSNKGLDMGFLLYKLFPNAQMHILDKANHFLWLDQWRDFNALVEWFVEKP